jgi:DNA-binding MarR family transcriptional regulator
MEELKELREVLGCPCLRIRRATRQITQLYDRILAEAGLTANQFGLLAYLIAAELSGDSGISIGNLAERVGVDPTTLNRNLKPLEGKGLVRDARGGIDARIRMVTITKKGKLALQKALPLWRQARNHVEKAIGSRDLDSLNGLLDLAATGVSRSMQ